LVVIKKKKEEAEGMYELKEITEDWSVKEEDWLEWKMSFLCVEGNHTWEWSYAQTHMYNVSG
jgi:hypothetical protein